MAKKSSHEEKSPAIIPQHVAIIMDGNGRWAKARGFPRTEGHRAGVKAAREIVRACGELGVKVLTLYTFSSENWKRPRSEVDALMKLLVITFRREIADLMRNNVKLRIIGHLEDFAATPRKAIEDALRQTESNTGMVLNLALSYGGRREIVEAAKALLKEGKTDLTEEDFSGKMSTAGYPDPDLLIRTSGEIRISNFLLWQLAYTELIFVETLWPDFTRKHLLAAFEEFGKRIRRFGTSG